LLNILLGSILTTTQPIQPTSRLLQRVLAKVRLSQTGLVFLASVFLVTVPVFFQAPLVRQWPEFSVILTLGWLGISWRLIRQPATWVWGDLLLGFSWSWFTGAIYWGWLRWEPLLHLPIEAIGVPFAIWCLYRGWGKVGNWFYLGSLFGTAVTDGYFYIAGLIPSWRQLMHVEPALALPIFQNALQMVTTPWGISWAVGFALFLFGVGVFPLQSKEQHWWAFGGAVLSTILVDSLFLIAACLA
jgi:Protein of unknown function (DUF3120).